MNRTIAGAAVALAASIVAVAAAQQTPASEAAHQPPVFRASTDVVQVDVVVHDKDGRFVPDLTAEDFHVSEEGHPQTIEQFYVVGGPDLTASAPATAPDATPSSAPSSVASPAAPPAPRTFIAIFDATHLSAGGFKRVQAAAVSLFEEQFHDGDIGGVLVDEQMAGNHLTRSRDELLKAVRDAKPSGKANFTRVDQVEWPRMSAVEAVRIETDRDDQVYGAVYGRACQDQPAQCQAGVDISGLIRGKAARMAAESTASTDATLRTLAGLMNGLARLDGRKTLLLLTEGFMAEDSWPFVQNVVGLAARAHATIYTLDARGLHGAGPDGPPEPTPDDAVTRMLRQMDLGGDSMNSLAIDTGGFVVRNTNIFNEAVARIADDASHYYVLGYRPEKAPDGKFRKISVKVDRKDVLLRARKGYVATDGPAVTTTDAAPTAAATAAVARPLDVSALHPRSGAVEHIQEIMKPAADADAQQGWDALQRGDAASARTALATAAARPNADPWVRYALGQADFTLKKYDEAVPAWEKVRAARPDFRPVYLDLVDGYLRLREPDKALRLLHDAERRWPKDAEIEDAIGVVHMTRGQVDEAIASFKKAVAAAPDQAIGYFNLGKAFELRYRKTGARNKQDFDSAIANYKRYLEIGGPLADSARQGLQRLQP
jgi:VWFA-related protein